MRAWPVDAHVHLHELRRVNGTLEAAAGNLSAAGGQVDGFLGALLLAQCAEERVFECLCEARTVGAWSFTPAPDEPETLIARRGSSWLALTCGRQVRAADGLEVLALGTVAKIKDGLPLAEAVDAVRLAGGLAVLPWGFGKWLGVRGERVRSVLAAFGPDLLFVGDNGGRLSLAAEPVMLVEARRQGFRVLPGSDPFPLAGDYRRVGGFGFLAEAPVREAAPWRVLIGWLRNQRASPPAYGRACGPVRFAANQLGIQLRNRLVPRRRR